MTFLGLLTIIVSLIDSRAPKARAFDTLAPKLSCTTSGTRAFSAAATTIWRYYPY